MIAKDLKTFLQNVPDDTTICRPSGSDNYPIKGHSCVEVTEFQHICDAENPDIIILD
jgi:hypothetical protein